MHVPIYIFLGVLVLFYAAAWPVATRCEDAGGRAVIGVFGPRCVQPFTKP